MVRSSPLEGLTKIGGELKYVFSVENASSHWASQWKAFFKTWKNGWHLSLDLDTKELFSHSNVESLWCSKMGACLARLLSYLDLPIFLGC